MAGESRNDIADAYEQSVRTLADIWDRDLQEEALAAIQGAARCLTTPMRCDIMAKLLWVVNQVEYSREVH